MFKKYTFSKFWFYQFLVSFSISILPVLAEPPLWWRQAGADGHFAIDPNSTDTNPLGPANIGQAKYMAKRALEALRIFYPEIATEVEANLVGPDKAIPSWDVPASGSPDAAAQFDPLLVGQLKAISAPFYTALHEADSGLIFNQLEENETIDLVNPQNFFPWTLDPADDANHAIATIGQLKAVFALKFEKIPQVLTPEDESVPEDGDDEYTVDESITSASLNLENLDMTAAASLAPRVSAITSATPTPREAKVGARDYEIQFKKGKRSLAKHGYGPLYINEVNKNKRFLTVTENIFFSNVNWNRYTGTNGWVVGYSEGGRNIGEFDGSHRRVTNTNRLTGITNSSGSLNKSRWANQTYVDVDEFPVGGGVERLTGTGQWIWWFLGEPPDWQYDIPPFNFNLPSGGYFDAPATVFLEHILNDENTIEMVKETAFQNPRDYSASWKTGSPTATFFVWDNEMGVTYSRVKFRFKRNGNNNISPVRAVVLFTPKTGGSPQFIKDIKWNGKKPYSTEIDLDPAKLRRGIEGTFHISTGSIEFEPDLGQHGINPVLIVQDATNSGGGSTKAVHTPALNFPGMNDTWFNNATITLTKLSGDGAIRINAVHPTNGTKVEVPQGQNLAGNFYKSGGIYSGYRMQIEGITPGTVKMELKYTQRGTTLASRPSVKVIGGDLDIDSDNSGIIDSTIVEENIENDLTRLGKILGFFVRNA
jgi:hypothetical protein